MREGERQGGNGRREGEKREGDGRGEELYTLKYIQLYRSLKYITVKT